MADRINPARAALDAELERIDERLEDLRSKRTSVQAYFNAQQRKLDELSNQLKSQDRHITEVAGDRALIVSAIRDIEVAELKRREEREQNDATFGIGLG